MSALTLLLADDHRLVRAGLKSLLLSMPDIQEVLEAANGQEALRVMERLGVRGAAALVRHAIKLGLVPQSL